jgi:hypothetical protein
MPTDLHPSVQIPDISSDLELISADSQRYKMLMGSLNFSKLKSNTDTLCCTCWKVLNYYDHKKHKAATVGHLMLTAKHFTSEKGFLKVASEWGKIHDSSPTESGRKFTVECPYKDNMRMKISSVIPVQ